MFHKFRFDELFDRCTQTADAAPDVPWADDGTLHIAVFHGRTCIGKSDACSDLTFRYEGPALNIDRALNLECGVVSGNVSAGGNVNCEEVYGSVNAGGSVSCNEVYGNLNAGGNVTCDDVDGDVHAGGGITCDTVEGNAQTGGNITCDRICGSAKAEGDIYCNNFCVDSADERAERAESGDQTVRVRKVARTNGDGSTITCTFSKN